MDLGTTETGPSLDSAPVSTTRETGSSWRANQESDKPRNSTGIPTISASHRFSVNRDPVADSDVSLVPDFRRSGGCRREHGRTRAGQLHRGPMSDDAAMPGPG